MWSALHLTLSHFILPQWKTVVAYRSIQVYMYVNEAEQSEYSNPDYKDALYTL